MTSHSAPGSHPNDDRPPVVAPGNVAVVTGAASGIGFGLASRFVAAGMRVVLSDIEPDALQLACRGLSDAGAQAIGVLADVSVASDVDAVRDAALTHFGGVHLLCNNAGVGTSDDPVWQLTEAEWSWVLGVNLSGVTNGLRSFMPLLADQEAAHIVNTASSFGVFAGVRGAYGVSKHAVVALTETLFFQLADVHPQIGVTLLCPGAVRTRITSSDRNRPTSLPTVGSAPPVMVEAMNRLVAEGKDPAEVAEMVVDAIGSRRFYLLTHDNRDEAILRRAREMVTGTGPTHPLAL